MPSWMYRSCASPWYCVSALLLHVVVLGWLDGYVVYFVDVCTRSCAVFPNKRGGWIWGQDDDAVVGAIVDVCAAINVYFRSTHTSFLFLCTLKHKF